MRKSYCHEQLKRGAPIKDFLHIIKQLYQEVYYFLKLILKRSDFKICNLNAHFIHAYKIRQDCNGYGGLNVSSDLTVRSLQNHGFKAQSLGFHDDNEIDKIIYNERPSHVIIKAFWIRRSKLELLAQRYPSCKFIICCHSKPSFLASETNGIKQFVNVINLSLRFKNIYIAANNEDMVNAMSKAYNCHVLFLPNIIEVKNIKHTKPFFKHTLKIGIFCAIRSYKNILNQALAAIVFCRDSGLRLELNVLTGRIETEGQITLKNLRDLFDSLEPKQYKLIEHIWLEHNDFLSLVRQMDIGLQASFTESFNIVATDFLKEGIPVVVGDSIIWAPKNWRVNPDNILQIEQKIKEFIYSTQKQKTYRLNQGIKALAHYNKIALKIYGRLSCHAKKW